MGENTSDRKSEEGARTRERASTQLRDDELYRALAARSRRRALSYLLEREEATVDEVAAMLVGWETADTGGMAAPNDHARVRQMLRHVHLPVLAEAGLVAYDDAGTVALDRVDDDVADLVYRSVAAGE